MIEAIQKPTDYRVRWATQMDYARVVTAYKKSHIAPDGTLQARPSTVFERAPNVFADAIRDERMLLLTDSKDDIKVFGAIHLLPASAKIGSTIGDAGEERTIDTKFNVAEIGSIYRPGEEPSGFCLEMMYDVLVLQTLKKARDRMIQMLITQVVADNKVGIQKLIALQQGWERCVIEATIENRFKETIPDPESRAMPLQSYHARPRTSVLAAADSLLGMKSNHNDNTFSIISIENGVIESFDRVAQKKVSIDLSDVGVLEMANHIAFNTNDTRDTLVSSWSQLHEQLLVATRFTPKEPANSQHRAPLSEFGIAK